jgi:hypothetical protein
MRGCLRLSKRRSHCIAGAFEEAAQRATDESRSSGNQNARHSAYRLGIERKRLLDDEVKPELLFRALTRPGTHSQAQLAISE